MAWNWSGASTSTAGGGACSRIVSSSGRRSVRGPSSVRPATACFADAYTTGNSSCASFAPSSTSRSKTSSITASARCSGRSTLFTTRMGRSPCWSAFRSTKRVCGITPSTASTSSSTASTMPSTRSTSPPKSAWPGVSTRWMRTPSNSIAVFLAWMVMPRSRSRSSLSITRSTATWRGGSAPVWRRRPSSSVVLPWSTCAMIARLRTSLRGAAMGRGP